MSSVTVRHATATDHAAISPLFAAYLRFYGREHDLAASDAFLADRFAHQDSRIFLARDEVGPVGFAQVYPSFSSTRLRRSWILNDLFVAPEARGRGVGRALLEAVRVAAESDGVATISLHTAVDNTPARSLYASAEYAQDETFLLYSRRP